MEIDLDDIRGTHLHPRDLGGALLSLDAAVPPASWRWAGPQWQQQRRSRVARAIVGVEMQCAETEAVARRWAELLGRRVRRRHLGTSADRARSGELRFVPGPAGADGVTVVDVALTATARVREREIAICGTRVRFV